MTTLMAMQTSGGPINPPLVRDDTVRRLNHILCEEIAAALAYRATANRVAGDRDAKPYVGILRQLEEEHGLAAEAIREALRERGGEPTDACGSLGAWSSAAHCPLSLFGRAFGAGSALECLRDAERTDLDEYRDALAALDPPAAQLLGNLVMPAQRRHVRLLDELLGAGTGA